MHLKTTSTSQNTPRGRRSLITFGGPHACTWRFLGDVAIKLTSVHLVTNYEMKSPERRTDLMIMTDITIPVTFKEVSNEQ